MNNPMITDEELKQLVKLFGTNTTSAETAIRLLLRLLKEVEAVDAQVRELKDHLMTPLIK